MILEEKTYLQKEIAEWMEIKPRTFSQFKQKKLKELEFFANFHFEGRKIVVDKVKIPIYEKQASRNYQIVYEEFPKQWGENGYDQCSNVSVKIQNLRQDLTTKESTTYNYTLKAKKDYVNRGAYAETRVFAIKVGKNGNAIYRALTPEESSKVTQIIKMFFGEDKDQERLLYSQAYSKGEIDDKEYAQIMFNLSNYTNEDWLSFIAAAEQALKLEKGSLVQATLLEENAIILD